MAKKAARKTTKVTVKNQENYLPLLLIILAASLFFFWLVTSTQMTTVQPTAILKNPTPTTSVKTKVTPVVKVTPKAIIKK